MSTITDVPLSVQKYRKELADKVPAWYSAQGNYMITVLISFPLVIYALLKIKNIEMLDLAIVPVFIFFASGFEYFAHRYLLHHRVRFFQKPFVEHTLKHHRYFTSEAIEVETSKDFSRVFFPVWGVFMIQYGGTLPLSLAFGQILSPNAGFLTLITGAIFFFMYETIHMICHLPKNNLIFKIPGLLFLREHHRLHHDQKLMSKKNFNIVIPIWDFLMRTRA
jgi:hypothetical protein